MTINQLPSLPALDNSAEIPVCSNGADYKATIDTLFAAMTSLPNGSSMYDFCRNTNYPAGVYFRYVQDCTDNPTGSGNVAFAFIMKPLDNGNYSIIFLFGSGKAYVTSQLGPSATSFSWTQL